MAAGSTSFAWQTNPEDDASTSDNKNIPLIRKTRCLLCQLTFYSKRVLRIVISESSFHVTTQLIRLDIVDGLISLRSEKTINFLKVTEKNNGCYPTRDDFSKIQSAGRSFETISDLSIVRCLDREQCRCYPPRRSVEKDKEGEKNDYNKSRFFESFICRFAENLGIDTYTLEKCIDNAITSDSDILLDIDYHNLVRSTSRNIGEIEYAIINIFWHPRATREPSNLVVTARSKNCFRSRSVPSRGSKTDSWFQSVDHGQVVPFHPGMNVPLFKISNTIKELLGKCIHEIEESMLNAFSWYIDEYFYHDFVFPRNTLPYSRYVNYEKNNRIFNPKVTVVKENPLDLDTHFAYVLTLNFYSHHKYVRRYMRENGLSCDSIIRIGNDIPFVVRSLNPNTHMHIFHMVYKRDNHSRPSYENIFKALVVLRDAMFRLRLKDISMCKIGCCCERLDFGKILRMTEYIFLETNINVRIGLNLMECWHSRSRTSRNQIESSESADLHLKRINRFFYNDIVEVPDISSTGEE